MYCVNYLLALLELGSSFNHGFPASSLVTLFEAHQRGYLVKVWSQELWNKWSYLTLSPCSLTLFHSSNTVLKEALQVCCWQTAHQMGLALIMCVCKTRTHTDSPSNPRVNVCAYLSTTHTLTWKCTLCSVMQSAGAANTSREHLRGKRKPNPLRWETVTTDMQAYGWPRAFQRGQIMIDACSRSLHNSLCIPNPPESLCRSQMSN